MPIWINPLSNWWVFVGIHIPRSHESRQCLPFLNNLIVYVYSGISILFINACIRHSSMCLWRISDLIRPYSASGVQPTIELSGKFRFVGCKAPMEYDLRCLCPNAFHFARPCWMYLHNACLSMLFINIRLASPQYTYTYTTTHFIYMIMRPETPHTIIRLKSSKIGEKRSHFIGAWHRWLVVVVVVAVVSCCSLEHMNYALFDVKQCVQVTKLIFSWVKAMKSNFQLDSKASIVVWLQHTFPPPFPHHKYIDFNLKLIRMGYK